MEYRENTKTIQEKTWSRPRGAAFELPVSGARKVVFREELVRQVDGVIAEATPVGEFSALLTTGSTAFPLLNPQDGQPTGRSLTYAELYAAIYSLYRYLAALRDA